MTELLINMLCIAIFIACFEISGFMMTTEDIINKKMKMLGKPGHFSWGYPLGCNVCQCFWCELIYIIICGEFSLVTAAICIMLAVSQRAFIAAIQLIIDTLETVFIKINEKIND